MTTTALIIISFALIIGITILAPTNLAITTLLNGNTTVSITPKNVYSLVGAKFSVNVTITNVTDLSCWQVKLNFNPSILNCTEITVPEDNVFSGHITTGLGVNLNNAAGYLVAFNGLWESGGVNGSGNLFTVTFLTLSPGISSLYIADLMTLDGTYLADSKNKLIPIQSTSGIAQVSSEGFYSYTFNVTGNGVAYNITIFTNSTITNFNFNYTLQKISFEAAGTSNTSGSCSISIPNELLNGTFAVIVNGSSISYTMSMDSLNQYLCFSYMHSINEIQIITTIVGDINGDRTVDMKDIIIAARAFGTSPNDPRWDPRADINKDLKVDMKDIIVTARNFGKQWKE
jgi:hypothetical protein